MRPAKIHIQNYSSDGFLVMNHHYARILKRNQKWFKHYTQNAHENNNIVLGKTQHAHNSQETDDHNSMDNRIRQKRNVHTPAWSACCKNLDMCLHSMCQM